ncbi:MAG: hypothetical protein QOC56_2572 [Alphaproteobacteria bacterium]|jgi:hypothetical protein|nr:hypothetical protein [Alphaproteobacteria bacterium]
MASIASFLSEATVFDEAATRALDEAFDAACAELHRQDHPFVVREIIAKRIIAAALLGEGDPTRLRNAGIHAMMCMDKWL